MFLSLSPFSWGEDEFPGLLIRVRLSVAFTLILVRHLRAVIFSHPFRA